MVHKTPWTKLETCQSTCREKSKNLYFSPSTLKVTKSMKNITKEMKLMFLWTNFFTWCEALSSSFPLAAPFGWFWAFVVKAFFWTFDLRLLISIVHKQPNRNSLISNTSWAKRMQIFIAFGQQNTWNRSRNVSLNMSQNNRKISSSPPAPQKSAIARKILPNQ